MDKTDSKTDKTDKTHPLRTGHKEKVGEEEPIEMLKLDNYYKVG